MKAESGAIMIVVAIVAALLILFAGLAIDGSILATSKVQQRHAAEFIALAALKVSAQTPGSNWDKLDAAVARAREIAGKNIFLAEPFLKIPFQMKELGSNLLPDAGASTNSHGRIIPGIWYFQPGPAACNATLPLNPTPCPCDSAAPANWATPCFRPLDFTDPAEAVMTVNAFKVELKTSTASPIRTLFTKLGGQDYVSISSASTAAYIPQHGVFLVDLSRSSHIRTHIPYETTTSITPTPAGRHSYATSAESAFRIKRKDGAAPPPACPADHVNTCFYNFIAPNLVPRCEFEGGISGNLYDAVYNFVQLVPPSPIYTLQNPGSPLFLPATTSRAPTDITPPTRHYKRDYQCFDVSYTEQYPDGTVSPAQTESYLVDTYRGQTDTGDTYDGPEPLTSMRAALYHALELFEARAVPGDRIGLVGFDRSATIDKRVFKTDATGAPQTVVIGSTEFNAMKDATNVDRCLLTDPDCDPAVTNTPLDEVQLSNHFFFPRVIAGDSSGNTNVPEALRVAYNMLLDAPDAANATNFVVLMSDGVTTCLADRTCGSDHTAFQNSFAEVQAIITNNFVKDSIRFDVVMIGERVGTHTLLVPYPTSSPTRCADDNDLRLEYPPVDFVDWSSYPGGVTAETAYQEMQKGTGIFYGAQQFYQLVRETGGNWLPVRPPCSPGIDVTPDLNAECAAGVMPVVKAPYTEDPARLICDPKGRTEREQLTEAIDAVFSKSPFVLVDEGTAEGY